MRSCKTTYSEHCLLCVTRSLAVLEVKRNDEFSPVKNAPGSSKDCPETARAALMDLHYRQILSAGGKFLDEDGKALPVIPRK